MDLYSQPTHHPALFGPDHCFAWGGLDPKTKDQKRQLLRGPRYSPSKDGLVIAKFKIRLIRRHRTQKRLIRLPQGHRSIGKGREIKAFAEKGDPGSNPFGSTWSFPIPDLLPSPLWGRLAWPGEGVRNLRLL